MRDDQERLRDILEAIDAIELEASKGKDAFERNRLIQTWIVHHLQVLGEAASKVSAGLRKDHPHIPWAQIVAVRNVLVHEYFGVDLDEVWAAVEVNLPTLKREIAGVLHGLEQEDQPS